MIRKRGLHFLPYVLLIVFILIAFLISLGVLGDFQGYAVKSPLYTSSWLKKIFRIQPILIAEECRVPPDCSLEEGRQYTVQTMDGVLVPPCLKQGKRLDIKQQKRDGTYQCNRVWCEEGTGKLKGFYWVSCDAVEQFSQHYG